MGEKNVRDGDITQVAFVTPRPPKIREAKGKYSVGDCQSSSGYKKSFYQVHVQQQQPRDGLRPPVKKHRARRPRPNLRPISLPSRAGFSALAAPAWGSRSGVVQRLALAHGGAGAFQSCPTRLCSHRALGWSAK